MLKSFIITNDYRKAREERMKIEREDRVNTFNQMLNKSRNVVADEQLFQKNFFISFIDFDSFLKSNIF